jgi:hypothetical protein
MAQCEQISHETGCWLFLAAQHPNATKPYLHYTSPRLRRDAMPQTTAITNQFHGLMTDLHRARYQNAFELQTELAQAQKTAADAKAECETIAKNAEMALANKQAEIDTILALYRSALN